MLQLFYSLHQMAKQNGCTSTQKSYVLFRLSLSILSIILGLLDSTSVHSNKYTFEFPNRVLYAFMRPILHLIRSSKSKSKSKASERASGIICKKYSICLQCVEHFLKRDKYVSVHVRARVWVR